MEMVDEYPDIIIGCVGGGSNFAGIAFPFLRDKLTGVKKNLKVIAVEPASCPTLTQGNFEYDFGDEAGMTPLLKMYTLGHNFIPPKIHAGGLRYHGAAPSISLLYNIGAIEANAYEQMEVFQAAQLFAQTEGIVPAPESSHAIKETIVQALRCKETGERKTILFNLSGHGFLDLGSYEMFLEDQLENYSGETNYAKVAVG
jgi:tryptophan synthase beta chain